MFGPLNHAQLRQVIATAAAAPSLHNSQPWRFLLVDDELLICAAIDRALWVADPSARALYMSCGAALFNAQLASRALSCDVEVSRLPHPEYSFDVLAVLRAAPGEEASPDELALHDSIFQRRTNRRPFRDERVPASVRAELVRAAAAEHAFLHMLNRADVRRVLALAAAVGRDLAADPEHESELQRWVGVDRSDGIPAEALPPRASKPPSPVRDVDFLAAAGESERPVATFEDLPQLAVLATNEDEPEDWLRAGEALQHVLLAATRRGVSASFLYHIVELEDMHEAERPRWPWPEHRQMVIRFGYGTAPVPAPRRDTDVEISSERPTGFASA
jgi:nitroreductase